jgi:hypothetical protein
MKYLSEIIFFLSWPVSIIISYYAVKWMLKLLDRPSEEIQNETTE